MLGKSQLIPNVLMFDRRAVCHASKSTEQNGKRSGILFGDDFDGLGLQSSL